MLKSIAACGALALILAPAASTQAGAIRGDYLEARTADVFTGPCFSNSEVFTSGNQAVVAWKVNQGTWNGVDLSGLTVAAAVLGTTTFSEDKPSAARAVLIVDSTATPSQRDALVAMAKSLGGDRLKNVTAVRTGAMSLVVERHDASGKHDAHAGNHHNMPQSPNALFYAPGLAEIATRSLGDEDHKCGNEVVAYPPLSRGVKVQPAFTLGHAFRAAGLGVTWSDPNARSSFVGEFTTDVPAGTLVGAK